jgi:hypothetical protein
VKTVFFTEELETAQYGKKELNQRKYSKGGENYVCENQH